MARREGFQSPMLASSGYVCQVDCDLCIACGDCSDYCQFSAMTMNEHIMHVEESDCMGCGVCTSHCEQGALTLLRDVSKGEPLELCALMN